MKRSVRGRTTAIAVALVLCAAALSASAIDPFIDGDLSAPQQQQQPLAPIRAAPTPPPTPSPTPGPAPAPPKPLQSPPAPAPQKPPTPTPAATPKQPQQPSAAAATPGLPKAGEPAVPLTKGAAQTAVPVPIATAPAKPVVRSAGVNITAVPTAAPPPAQRGAAVDTKKTGAALFDVKVKGTHVAISPSGDVMIRNPDVDINTMRVVQMIAGVVEAVKRVVEASKPAPSKAPAKAEANAEAPEAEGDDDEAEEKGGGDADGVSSGGGDGARMQPLPSELTADDTAIVSRPFLRRDGLVDDAKPYARKLHYRVRRGYTPGAAGSVGDIRFDGAAPILMRLQQISTIPHSEFAPDAYRFAVDVPGSPTFFVDLPLTKPLKPHDKE